MQRRQFLKKVMQGSLGLLSTYSAAGLGLWGRKASVFAETSTAAGLPVRPFGRTPFRVTLLGLGGEGILRTYGRFQEAVPVVERASELGINYFDTAPAYANSQDYIGAVFQKDPSKRDRVFLASKTHERSYDGSMRLLEDSLKRLHTDHLDLWQLHDLRTFDDLEAIFAPRGAMRALEKAQQEGRVRYLGFTGHHDPKVLTEAAERYDFDAALVALNAADRHRLSFIEEFLPVAERKQLAIIGMKVFSRGRSIDRGIMTAEEAMHYVLSLPVSHVIIGCDHPGQVEQNAAIAKNFKPLSQEKIVKLDRQAAPFNRPLTYYKKI